MLGYGDLDILTAADAAVDDFKMLSDAVNFKKQMLNAKHALEREIGGPDAEPAAPRSERRRPAMRAAPPGCGRGRGAGAEAAAPRTPDAGRRRRPVVG